MKRLRLPLLGSTEVIYAARSPSFTCVQRWHTSSPKGKGQNLISSNSLGEIYFPDCWLANPNIQRLLTLGHLTTPALPKRISIIFLWEEFSQRDTIHIVNPLLNTVRSFGGRCGTHSYSDSPKIKREQITYEMSSYPCTDLLKIRWQTDSFWKDKLWV